MVAFWPVEQAKEHAITMRVYNLIVASRESQRIFKDLDI